MLDPNQMSEPDRLRYYMNKYKMFHDAVDLYLQRYPKKRLEWVDVVLYATIKSNGTSFNRQDQIGKVVAECLGIPKNRIVSTKTGSKIEIFLAKGDEFHKVECDCYGGVTRVGWDNILEIAHEVEKLL